MCVYICNPKVKSQSYLSEGIYFFNLGELQWLVYIDKLDNDALINILVIVLMLAFRLMVKICRCKLWTTCPAKLHNQYTDARKCPYSTFSHYNFMEDNFGDQNAHLITHVLIRISINPICFSHLHFIFQLSAGIIQ